MRIKQVKLTGFRRFKALTISDLPETAKVVMLAGPNGNGKSSLFDAFFTCSARYSGGLMWDSEYYSNTLNAVALPPMQGVEIEFYTPPVDQTAWQKSFYIRTAYRNDPQFQLNSLTRVGPAIAERRFQRLIENDVATSGNYQRLVSQGLEDAYERNPGTMTLDEFRTATLGEISSAVKRIFPHLILNSLGNPLAVGSFRFSKGAVNGFDYRNLSGGEKAVFDLVLDHVIKQREYNDTAFCIDEPELHVNPKLHARLLEVLVTLTADPNQLWLATHSIGMLRAARDLERASPGSVVFLDFGQDFDSPVVVQPVRPDRAFWESSLEVALDDLSSLIAPKMVVLCEGADRAGRPGEGSDAKIYDRIFSGEMPDVRFISLGSSSDLEGDRVLVIQAMADLIQGLTIRKLVDRDHRSTEEVAELQRNGFNVLTYRHIESYLYSDEILTRLCQSANRPDLIPVMLQAKSDALAASASRGNDSDDMKSAAGTIYTAARRLLQLANCGNNSKAFMRDTLAPLVTAETSTYQLLKTDIFGPHSA